MSTTTHSELKTRLPKKELFSTLGNINYFFLFWGKAYEILDIVLTPYINNVDNLVFPSDELNECYIYLESVTIATRYENTTTINVFEDYDFGKFPSLVGDYKKLLNNWKNNKEYYKTLYNNLEAKTTDVYDEEIYNRCLEVISIIDKYIDEHKSKQNPEQYLKDKMKETEINPEIPLPETFHWNENNTQYILSENKAIPFTSGDTKTNYLK